MLVKADFGETAEPEVGRGPDGTVKATLPEPQHPLGKHEPPGLAVIARCPTMVVMSQLTTKHIPGAKITVSDLKDANEAPTAVLNVTHDWNAGLPTGREPYGNGAPIVVRGRESRPHGEGGQVTRDDRA